MDITGIAQVLESQARLLSDIPTHLCFDVQKVGADGKKKARRFIGSKLPHDSWGFPYR